MQEEIMNKYLISGLMTFVLILGSGLSQPTFAMERNFYLFDDMASYPWSGFMGSSSGQSLELNQRDENNPQEGVYCSSIHAEGWESWAGIYIQSQDSNWSGPGADFSGCTRLVFSYRGQPAGEEVEIKAFNDQWAGMVTLSNTWQTMEIPLSGLNVDNIYNILAFVVLGTWEKTVDIDEIYLVFDRPIETPSEVAVTGQGPPVWNYSLTVDGQDYFIRGAGYNASWPSTRNHDDFALMAENKINTIRLWGQGDVTPAVLDSASSAGLMACLSYWLPRGDEGPNDAPYTDLVFRSAVKRSVRNFATFYQEHPSILIWILGNEVFHNLNPGTEANRLALANLLDELAIELHVQDPHHPVTYASVTDTAIKYLEDTSLDLFGSNAFAALFDMLDSYRIGESAKPLILLEYGCDGWWETPWEDYSNLERAEDYGARTIRLFEERGLTLGGCAFAWIDKTEGLLKADQQLLAVAPSTGGNSYTGWGLVDEDLTPRPQLRAVNVVYQSEVIEDSNMRIHLNARHFCPGDSIKMWAFLANPKAVARQVDVINAIAWDTGYYFYPDWRYLGIGWDAVSVVIPPYYFAMPQTLDALWPGQASFPGETSAYGVLVEPGTLQWIGGPSAAIHEIPFGFGVRPQNPE